MRAAEWVKPRLRHAVDRIVVPYVDRVNQHTSSVAAPPAPAPTEVVASGWEAPMALRDFNHLLHSLRTANLRQIPTPVGVLLSAGCAGRWYFDWLEECCGPIERHIGIERYSPKPADLPSNAVWIEDAVDDMASIESKSVDVLFSGQNIEHLWVDQIVGFLCEANRVLADGGRLVLDSPNRLVVGPLGWAHPEHTIELSPDEAVDLVRLAGFEVVVCRGVWLVDDGEQVLPLSAAPDDIDGVLFRSVAAVDRPDAAFVWWVEATKAGPPAAAEVAARVRELFELHWADRVWRGRDELTTSTHFPLLEGTWRIDGDEVQLHGLGTSGVTVTAGDAGLLVEVTSAQFGVVLEAPIGSRPAPRRVEAEQL